jgi:hypothetical protein
LEQLKGIKSNKKTSISKNAQFFLVIPNDARVYPKAKDYSRSVQVKRHHDK